MACSKVSINFYYYDTMYLLSCHYPYTWISHYLQVPKGQGQQLGHLTGIQYLVQYQAQIRLSGCVWNLPTNQSINERQFSAENSPGTTSLTKWACNPPRRKITLQREENRKLFIIPVWTIKSLSGIPILPTLSWWVILKSCDNVLTEIAMILFLPFSFLFF